MGMRIVREWVDFEVSFYGEDGKQQFPSLRKTFLMIRTVPVSYTHLDVYKRQE